MKKFLCCLLALTTLLAGALTAVSCGDKGGAPTLPPASEESSVDDSFSEENSSSEEIVIDESKVTLRFATKTFYIEDGQTVTLDVEFSLDGQALSLSYLEFSSSDNAVATVDKNGVVTAVAEGETTIFATMSGVKASCRVVVENCVGTSGHQWKVVKTAPTCTEQGFETRTCSDCGAVQVLNYVAALGHEWKVQTIAPACEGKGYDKKVCTICKHEVRENYVKASGHVYGADDVCDVCGKRKEDAGWTDWIPIG